MTQFMDKRSSEIIARQIDTNLDHRRPYFAIQPTLQAIAMLSAVAMRPYGLAEHHAKDAIEWRGNSRNHLHALRIKEPTVVKVRLKPVGYHLHPRLAHMCKRMNLKALFMDR